MSFTPNYDARGWVEYAPGKFTTCGALDEHACLLMADELARDPTLLPEVEPLRVEVTEGVFDWSKYVFWGAIGLLVFVTAGG